MEAIEYFYHYLHGQTFTIITDHQALKWLSRIKKPNSRLFIWALKLSQYDFKIEYTKGSENLEADCLSRNPFEQQPEFNLLHLTEIQEESKKITKPKDCCQKNDIYLQQKHGIKKIFVP